MFRILVIIIIIIILEILLLSLKCNSINSNNFCNKLTEDECSQRYTPYIYQCGPNECTKNPTECAEYMKTKEIIRENQLNAAIRITSMSRLRNYNEVRLEEKFRKFQSIIKNCSKAAYEWRPCDVCIREKKQVYIMYGMFFHDVEVNCPKEKPHVCGNHHAYCTLNKEACESFI